MENIRKQKHPSKAPETMPKKNTTDSDLYAVKEVDGGFEVTLPGLFDNKREVIVGTSKQRFETKVQAEQAIEEARAGTKEFKERASLEKTFTASSTRIDQLSDGKFRVSLPGPLDSNLGVYFGVTHTNFATWQQAKEFFLQQRAKQEKLTHKPLLEIKTGDQEKIAFSDMAAFNPNVAPAEKAQPIPASIEKYLLDKERLAGTAPSASTYQETIKEKDWETKLFSFITLYLEKDGAMIAKHLKIKHLESLTPKQAIELATEIVIDLTKYKWSDTIEPGGDLTMRSKSTQADQSTVMQLLKQGLSKRTDPNWEGNGVCRNFASAVKAVFEALKAKQTKFSRLRDTYCLYDGGMEEFAPKREDRNLTNMDRKGHAWNTFVCISREGAANATIIDTTWAKRDLDTKKIEGLDYTLTRMEPVIQTVGQNFSETTPDKQEQLKHLLSYYLLKLESPSQIPIEILPINKLNEEERAYYKNFGNKYPSQGRDSESLTEDQLISYGQRIIAEIKKGREETSQKQFFITRAVALMTKQGVPPELPPSLIKAIGEEFVKIADNADPKEIVTLYKISLQNPDLNFSSVFKNYLKNKELTDYHVEKLIFEDNKLQRMAFEELKHRDGFTALRKDSPKFRVRMREVLPALFIDFSPATKPEDAQELKYLAGKEWQLQRYTDLIDTKKPSDEKIKLFFAKVRETLRAVNPQKYNETIVGLDNYQLVKQYSKLERELRV